MFQFLLLSALATYSLATNIPTTDMLPQLDERIIGGTETTISNFPWQVSIQRSGSHACGGAIYASNIIITAAHCLLSASSADLSIRAGSTYWHTDGVLVNVASFLIHEGYNFNTMINDIGIIRLVYHLSFSTTIKAIPLATRQPAHGALAVVTGWGTTIQGTHSKPDALQYTNVYIVSRIECGSTTYGYGAMIKTSMICAAAAGKDACQGDSGGPLVSNGLLVGIVSWGYGCASANYPGVYADVAALHAWIVSAAKVV